MVQFHKLDPKPERDLITNLITDTEFCKKILPVIDPSLLSETAKKIYKWVVNYYGEYGKAPDFYIQEIYDREKKKLKEEDAEWIGEVLARLSDKHEQMEREAHSVDFEIDKALDYIREQSLHKASKDIESLLEKKKLDKAEEVITVYKRPSVQITNCLDLLKISGVTVEALVRKKIPKPRMLIWPWLTENKNYLIYAPYGVGKSWLVIILSDFLTHGYDEVVGSWQLKDNVGVMYIDGEMGEYDVQERFKLLRNYKEENFHPRTPLYIVSNETMEQGANTSINLNNQEWKDAIFTFLIEHSEYKVLILDNVSSLVPGKNFYDVEEWSNAVGQWLIKLKLRGVTTIIVHHAGKDKHKGPRGTSAMSDAAEATIQLSHPKNWTAEDAAYFTVAFDKPPRTSKGGPAMRPFTVRIRENKDGSISWMTEEEVVGTYREALALLEKTELEQQDIARIVERSKATITKYKDKAKDDGLMDRDNERLTKKGLSLIKNVDVEELLNRKN